MVGAFYHLRAACCVLGVWAAGHANALEHFSTSWSSYVGGDYGSDRVSAVAADSAGNAYLGGTLGESGSIQNNAGAPVSLARPGFVAKTSAAGTLLWTRDFSEHGNYMDEILGLAAGPSRVFAAGCTQGSYADTGTYAFIAALNAADGTAAWSDTIGRNEGTNRFNAVAAAADGAIYAVGHTSLTNQLCNVPGYSVGGVTYGTALKGGTDAFVVKYSSAGAVLWRHYLGGARDDTAWAVAVSSDGFVYVAGETRSPGWVSLAASGTAGDGNAAGFLVKLTAAGAHVWSSYLNGAGHDAATALAVAPGDAGAGVSPAILLGGATASSDFLASAPRLGTAYAGGTDGFVARLTDTNTAFRVDWCRFTGGAGADQVSALGLLADGRLAAGGTTSSGGWFTLIPGSEAFHGARDGFVTLLNATDGAVSWTTCIGGTEEDALHGLAAAADSFFTVGHTFSPNWTGGGFWTEWNKDELYGGPYAFGFAVKWQPGAPIAPVVLAEPADRTVREHAAAAFTVAATGTAPLFYRWSRNGAPLAGATASNLTFTAAYADHGAAYSCLVSNLAGTVTSRAATLTVIPMGTLTLSIAPADAVQRGARWRLDSGPAWLASGLSTNLPAGAYAVSFSNLTGWTAPAQLPDVQVTHAATTEISVTYTPVLPEAERAVDGTNVAVTVRAPAGLAAWTLVENLPASLTPTDITAGGVWNAGARTLTFTGAEATTNTVAYRVICATSGVYTVSGTVTPAFASAAVPVTGENEILNAKLVRTIDGTSVTIKVLADGAWPVTEIIPEGLTPSAITGGAFNTFNNGQIFWYVIAGPAVLSYTATGAPGAYTLSGSSGIEPIFGDSVLTIPGADIPPPDILAFAPVSADAFALTFTSIVNQAYLILTNDSPGNAAWGLCIGPVTGADGTTQCEVPALGPRLFYRVQTLP
jgi:hypothetical protein